MYDRAKIKNLESVSKVTIENAIDFLLSYGVLKRKDIESKVPILLCPTDEECTKKLNELKEDINIFLGNIRP
jgi:hypothetical protein